MFFLNKKFDAGGRGRKKKRRYISVWKLTMLELMQLSQLPCCCPMRSHASTLYSYSFAPGHMRGKGRGFTTLEEEKFVFDNLWKLTRCPIYNVHSLIFAANSAPQLGSGVHCTQTYVQWDSSPLRPMQGESPRDRNRNVTCGGEGNCMVAAGAQNQFYTYLAYAYTLFYVSTYDNNFLLHA